jgi:hypothetical protein
MGASALETESLQGRLPVLGDRQRTARPRQRRAAGDQRPVSCGKTWAAIHSIDFSIWSASTGSPSRRSARFGDSATMRSQARSRAASSGQRATATQLNQCSTKYRAGSKLYSSRARAVAAVQSASNLARAAGSRRATAERIAAGSRSGSGTTGCSPDTGRWLMRPMLSTPPTSAGSQKAGGSLGVVVALPGGSHVLRATGLAEGLARGLPVFASSRRGCIAFWVEPVPARMNSMPLGGEAEDAPGA